MEIDSKPVKEQPVPSAKKEKGAATAPSSKAPSPKPARAAKETPQLPQGSGLITNALFGMGGDDSSKSPDSRTTPNIVVHIPLSKGNQIINFAQLAEEQYGFAALHPRLAAHKDRLARVAAAGAALERNEKGLTESADEDLSLEVDRDSDVDGDVTMSGPGTGTNGVTSDAGDGKKKRRKKVEEYDRDDPFVDDTEMAWQEQAAASKDGFFVYSGPLVPEGEKVQVERAVEDVAAVQVVAEHWLHIPMSPLLLLCPSHRIPVCLSGGPVQGGGTSRRPRGAKKADQGDKGTPDRNGTTASAAHEGRGGRAGGAAGSSRGGSSASTRGGKSSSMMSLMDMASSPLSNSTPNITPVPGPSPLAGPELVMK
ncbi:hypothetical protein N7513_005923 [Penicillium frequentans]|uniref:Hpc2-related domain-containing protein n=1 Tax=Penicillium frequentans TaxID=3151616 RepID=A0AAD6CT58_9EURO|nr:hypothetical protein N7494_007454 [Penicillium glabrum]KAJ5548689.1 hypothetical protein N7513_005923 [Penicillium glabrum]